MKTRVNELPPAIRAILRPQTVAGEDPAIVDELLALAIQEHDPKSFSECMLVKQRVDAELDILRSGLVRKWVFNAAIARTVLAQIVNAHVEIEIDEVRKKGRIVERSESGYEETCCQGWWRRMRRVSFAAVSGDNDAAKRIEEEIGPNKVNFRAETVEEFERTMPSLVFLDRALSAAISRRDAACRELDRLALRRSKRAAETCQLETRGLNENVPLAPADVSVGSPSSASVPVAESLNAPSGDWVSVRSPRPAPTDETTAQQGSDGTTAESLNAPSEDSVSVRSPRPAPSDETTAPEGSDGTTAPEGSDETARS